MEQYFNDVVESLTIEDIQLLSILFDNDATAAFKSLKSKDVLQITGYSEAVYRRVLNRLTANKFVGVISLNKQHGLYISGYGVSAISKSLSEVSVI
nr:hypothetical protein [Mycobacterium sp. E3298]